ncbi:carboxymuconolactone decarboxylase family protein [Paenarthrobacter sp. RAF54_2]|uniref:carboxymuconolactone decarboxylase family protein n=1 Tax=Paenarthrobacter sp. RAF54_2 TaxID=3233061 RepID=UPI003F944DC5
MSQVNIGKQHPGAYQGLMQLNKTIMESATDSVLDERLIEPVKIRAAQLNGCAFCFKLQIRDAIEQGETPDRPADVPVWWESQYFLEQERRAADRGHVTLLSDYGRVPELSFPAEH